MTSQFHINLKRTSLIVATLLLSLRINAAEHFAFADDYFHGGALRYLSNNVPGALDIVTNGLLQFPDDEKLKKLEALLKQQQQQQQQDRQQDQKKNEDQKKQDEQKKDQQSKKDDQQKEQDKKDQQKSDEQKEKEKQEQQKQAQQPKPDDQKKSAEQQQAEAEQSKQMTPEQAKRILDATKNEEQLLPFQPTNRPATDKKLKDW